MKKILGLSFVLTIIVSVSNCSVFDNKDTYFRIQENGEYGFIDSIGQVVISPTYKYVSEFTEEGYACVISSATIKDSVLNLTYGYIKSNNDLVIDTCQHLQCSMHDLNTIWRISPQYVYECVNKFNLKALDFNFTWFSELLPHNEMFIFQDEQSKLLGYKNMKNEIIISPQYVYASSMKFGVAFTSKGIKKDRTASISDNLNIYSLIDTKGNYIKRDGWALIKPFDANKKTWCAEVAIKDIDDDFSMQMSWTQIDVNGKIVIGPVPGTLGSVIYNNGNKDNSNLYIYLFPGMWGMAPTYSFIDKDGNFATDFGGDNIISLMGENAEVFKDVTNFSDGVAGVQVYLKNDEQPRWTFMNTDFQIVGDELYDSIVPYKDGLAAVESMSNSYKHLGKWGYVNREFELVIPYKFSEVKSFYKGLAYASIFGPKFIREGYINKLGEFVWETQRLN